MFESPIIFLQKFSSKGMDLLMNFFSFTGESFVIIAIVAYIYWNISKKKGITISIIFLLSMYINQILKLLVHTPRPYEVVPEIEGKRIETAGGHAFPSGHSQGASTFYFMIAWLYNRNWIWWASAILVLLVGVSRMYLGVHWPVDVAGGWLIGLLFAYIGYEMLYPYVNDDKNATKVLLGISLLLLLSAVSSIFLLTPEQSIPLYLMLATFWGTSAGYLLDMHYLNFEENAKNLGIAILRFLVGMGFVFVIIKGAENLIPHKGIDIFIRYFLVGIWISFIYPFLAKKVKLFE